MDPYFYDTAVGIKPNSFFVLSLPLHYIEGVFWVSVKIVSQMFRPR